MTMASPALSVSLPMPRRRSALVDFCRQQPLGTVSFVIIFAMMFAGMFAEWVAPYDPLEIDFG